MCLRFARWDAPEKTLAGGSVGQVDHASDALYGSPSQSDITIVATELRRREEVVLTTSRVSVSAESMPPDRMPPDTDVVVGGLYLNGATIIRRLAAHGFKVCGLSHDPTEVGFASGQGWKAACPSPAGDHDGWVAFLNNAASACRTRPVLLPTSDVWVVALDRASERLRDRFRIAGFGNGLHTALTSKRTTFELAERNGFPMPRTLFVSRRDQVLRFAATVDGPMLLKPEFSADWQATSAAQALGGRKVVVAENGAGLVAAYDAIRQWTTNLVVQEVIPGPDENLIYWCGLVRDDGRVAGRIIGRKIRVLPVHYGSASFVQLVDAPAIEDQCEAFLGALGYRGLCGIELKIDPRDGVAKLIEVNARYGLWEDIGIPVGIDLAHEAVMALSGQNPMPRRARSFAQKWVHLGRDLRTLKQYRAEGALSLGGWLRSLTPPIVVNDLPFLSDFSYALHNLRMLANDLLCELGKAQGSRSDAPMAGPRLERGTRVVGRPVR
jgi:D-aspartate ligase